MPIIVEHPSIARSGGVYDLAALVTARAKLAPYTVYRGTVPKTPPGAYVVLYFGAGFAYSTRLDGTPKNLRWTFRAVCAGYSEAQALNTADLLRSLLTGYQIEPANRAAGRLNEIPTDPPLLRDDSVAGDIRFSLTLLYRLNTNRSL